MKSPSRAEPTPKPLKPTPATSSDTSPRQMLSPPPNSPLPPPPSHANENVPIDGPTSMFCDNESVTKNASVPESTLSKKHNAICYNKVRESVAAGWIQVGWIRSENNLADLFTKVLNGQKRLELLEHMMTRPSG